MDLEFLNPLPSMQTDQNYNHTAFDVFGSNDLQDMVRNKADEIEPGGYAYVFRFGLQYVLRYKALFLKKE